MPARTTRKEARARLMKTMMDALDRIIPEDESKPLKGSKFIDWEKQATAFKQAVIPTLLEERAALEAVDSGTDKAPVVYRAYRHEPVVFRGGPLLRSPAAS